MITKTQYWVTRIALSVMFFVSGYAVGYGTMAAFTKHPGFILLALAGVGAYIFFLRLNNKLTVLWQRQQIREAVDDAWTRALDELRERGDIK